jgi:alpha-tubulin suppressor-like RCC1 family protein
LARLATVALVLVTLGGCSLIAGLGDPKELGAPATPNAVSVAVSESHACAIVNLGAGNPENGSVRCWGSNDRGQLGNDPTSVPESFEPLTVQTFPNGWKSATTLAVGEGFSCAASPDGYLACWGDVPDQNPGGVHLESTPAPYQPAFADDFQKQLGPVVAISLNASGGCVLETLSGPSLSLVCWGQPAFEAGRMGGAVTSSVGYSAIGVGGSNACAATSKNPTVECWGDNSQGQSGEPAGGRVANPRKFGPSADFVQIAIGADFACALTSDGTVYCWGNNDRGQLGPGGGKAQAGAPVLVPFSGTTVSAITAGDAHACALMADGEQEVRCWGDNSADQLGVGPTPPYSTTPMTVQRPTEDGGIQTLPHVQQISAGGQTTCAVRSTAGRVVCWGANTSGQAGQRPSTSIAYATPVNW